jgi:hypothetical protein
MMFQENFVIDKKGHKIAVQVPIRFMKNWYLIPKNWKT